MKTLQIILLFTALHISANEIELTISGAQQTQMPIAIIVLDETNNELSEVATTIKKNLQFTDQFHPRIIKYNAQLSKKELRKNIKNLSNTGVPLALCITTDSPGTIKWRLYDTMQCTMLKGKKYTKKSSLVRVWAHAITDSVWKTLTGNDGFFSSRLVYCKDSKSDKSHTIRKLYIADFDGSHEELIVDIPTICITPRWHPNKPYITYSEYTDTNVQLMSVSMNKQKKSLSNFDGINMLATFSSDNTTMTYCSSRGSGSCQIYLLKNDSLKRCTNNTGNNTSPIFIDETHLCFCSDVQTGSPQIYIADIKTGHLQRITHGGYCTSPNYCKKTNKIAYHKMIQGIMQIMIYDCTTKIHTQKTKTNENKHEVCFSPCGTQLLFVHEIPGKNSRLCSLNLLTDKTIYITSAHEQCSYPHWSPCYQTFPVVT
jgi:TolB protein